MKNISNLDENHSRKSLVLKISPEGLYKIQALFESGELSKLLGVDVLDMGAINASKQPVNLDQCLPNNATVAPDADWDIIQQLLEPKAQVVMRNRERFHSHENQIILNKLLEQLSTCSDEDMRLNIAQTIAEIDTSNQTAIADLTELAHTTQDEEIRWRAIEILAEIAPDNLPNDGFGIMRELRLASHTLKLSISTVKRPDDEVSVFIRIYPSIFPQKLPKGIKLILLNENGEIFDQVPSDSEEYEIIQYKVIYKVGEKFSVRVTLGSDSITENFVA